MSEPDNLTLAIMKRDHLANLLKLELGNTLEAQKVRNELKSRLKNLSPQERKKYDETL